VKKSGNQEINQWYLLGSLGIVLFVLGIAGFDRYAAWHNLTASIWDNIYLTFQLIPMNSGGVTPPIPLELNLARFFIPLLAAATAIKAFLRIFQEQVRMLRLHRLRDHIVICGLSRKGFLLAQQFRQNGDEVVIVERDEENKWLESCRDQGMFVLVGDATDANLLHRAGVGQARGLFAVCEEDGINAAIVVQSQALVVDRTGESLKCLVHITDPQLCTLLRQQESNLERVPLRMELFNVFERGARQLVYAYPAWKENLLEKSSIPHILIVGLGWMGENVALHLARDWWRQQPDQKKRLQITVIDRQATGKAVSLQTRYPQIAQACDLHPLDLDIYSAEYEKANFLYDEQGKNRFTQAFICLDNDALGLHAGLMLHHQMLGNAIPIVIRMADEKGLARLLQNRPQKPNHLFAFGYLDHTCTIDLLDETISDILARAAHEQYLQHQTTMGEEDAQDPAMLPWEQLDQQTRAYNYRWVYHIPVLLNKVGYSLAPLNDWDAPSLKFSAEQVESMAQLEHQLWSEEKIKDGWTYAPGGKDLRARTNPDLVAWEVLAEDEREKNRELITGLPLLLENAGFQINADDP
jgi:hypothetical protein